jgi:hypothetical protein
VQLYVLQLTMFEVLYCGQLYVLHVTVLHFGIAYRFMFCDLQCGNLVQRTYFCPAGNSGNLV